MSKDTSHKPAQSVGFRPATPEYIADILDMMEAFYTIDQYPFDRNLNEKNLLEFLTNENLGRLWLIYSDEAQIGYAVLAFGYSFEYKGRDAFLDEFFLKENFRGKGIGKAVIDFVIEQAPQLGVKAIHLEVERHNEKAIRLYESRGFSGKSRYLLTRYISGPAQNHL